MPTSFTTKSPGDVISDSDWEQFIDPINNIENGISFLAVDTSSNDDYTATVTPAPPTLNSGSKGYCINFQPLHNNVGPCTLTLNGGSAKSIKTALGADPGTDVLVAGGIYMFAWDGTYWQIASGSFDTATAAATAADITNVAAGSISGTDVQAAINELDGDIQGHISDTTDAHNASAISYDNSTSSLTATEVQAAVDEVKALLDASSGLPTGSAYYFADNGTPSGAVKADGSAISRTTYADLFSVLGTLYGAGDGSTTFNVPDLTRKHPAGYQQTADTLASSVKFDLCGSQDLKGHNMGSYGFGFVDYDKQKLGRPSFKFANDTSRLTVADSSDFSFGSSDFCVEAWVWMEAMGSIKWLWYQDGGVGGSITSEALVFGFDSSGVLASYATSAGASWDILNNELGVSSISTNQWVHVAMTRSGTTGKYFIDGAVDKTFTITGTIHNSSNRVSIGSQGPNATIAALNGWLAHLRITIGNARYTSAFTPDAGTRTDWWVVT